MTLKKLFTSLIILFFSLTIHSQDCSNSDFNNGIIGTVNGNTGEAAPFCSDTGIVFCNSLLLEQQGIIPDAEDSAQIGPNYGCLGSEPFPSWFFIRIDQPGNLDLTISQTTTGGAGLDVDFIIWGPFNQTQINAIQGGDTTLLNAANTQDCSYAPDAVEFLSVSPVANGEFYVILITNFGSQAGTIEMVSTNPGDPDAGSTDCSIIAGDLGQDQDVCEGETVTLDGTPTIGVATGYRWFLDEGAGFVELAGETNATLIIDDDRSGTYRVEVTNDGGDTAQDDVVITFHPQPTIGTLGFTTFEQCDTDANEDGFFIFDLEALFGATLLNGQDPTIFQVAFYDSQADADSNSSPLNPNNYQNDSPFSTDQIFARVFNIAAPDACTVVTTSFNVQVLAEPTIQNTADYEECDNDTDGDDTSGQVQSFDLSTKDNDILGGQDPTIFEVSYHLSASDAEDNLNPIDKTTLYLNPTPGLQPIYVRVTNNTTNCFAFTNTVHFNLVVNPLPVVTDPVALEICDNDQNGLASFDLTQAQTLISPDAANESFRYYPSETDAQNLTNEIMNPTNYTNVVDTNDAVWVRTITINGCFRISRVNLLVTNTAVADSWTYEVCDDYIDAGNDDQDGITTFNFADVNSLILDPFPDVQEPNITITYHESLADANSGINQIMDISAHRNTISPNSQQIFIRVENSANNACLYTGTNITLNVLPVPIANTVPDMDICDDDSDGDDTNGFVQSIDLESQTPGILGAQDPTLFTVTYHPTPGDATAGSNMIASPFTNTSANTQTIYVRVTNNTNGCFTDRSSFDVNVRPLPVVLPAVELKQCDDNTDGFVPFNLFEAGEIISTNFANETFEFFETQADAMAGTNVIPNPTTYTNQVITTDLVWARTISTFGCYRISEVTLTVATNGAQVTTFPPRTYNACDDYLDIDGNDTVNNDDTDGVTGFDFSDFGADIIAVFPIAEQPFLTVEYYRTEADALAELNQIPDPSNYRNIGFPNTQQIYVRVDNSQNNECIGFSPLITLIVDPVPVANPVADLEECDNADDGDFANGIIQTFDLTSRTAGILGAQDPNVYTVTYHTTALDANQGINAITNTTAYTNQTPNQQTIYIRVTHNTQGCFVDRASFDLIVNPTPGANFVEDLEVCDNLAGGSAQDGVADGIDLTVQTTTILGTQDPAVFSVSYHLSFNDAQDGTNAIPNPTSYQNTTPSLEIIYIRVLNNTTGCANGISNFNLIIHPEPTVETFVPEPYCDNDDDGDDTNGIIQTIDLNSLIPQILGTSQDEDDYTVTFHAELIDAQIGTLPLSTPYTNQNPGGDTVYVRVVNDDTGCVNDDLSLQIIVNPLPDFTVTTPQIVCLNGPELTLFVENPQGTYDYTWTDPDGNETFGTQLTVTTGGTYNVVGRTIDGTNCERSYDIVVNESIIATLTESNVSIEDESSSNTITIIDPTLLGIGDYEYSLLDDEEQEVRPYQDEPLFDNLPGGIYTILVRDKNGCGVASLEVAVVEYPKFFTPNNDGVNDTWAIKGANSTFFPGSQVNIFNRFGKVVAQINIDNPGWDGTFNGKDLPSDDYWFSVNLVHRDGVTVKNFQGNFSLLRR